MQTNVPNANLKENEDRNRVLEGLKKFFANDMKIKKTLVKMTPTELETCNEEKRIEYVDELYKSLREIESQLLDGISSFDFYPIVKDEIKHFFDGIKEKMVIADYDSETIQKIYKENFSSMNAEVIEEVKQNCVGYTYRNDLPQLIQKTKTVNELLHVIHSHITNNQDILQTISIIDTKKNKENYAITLYGEENELSRKLFEEFPLDMMCGWTDIIAMQDKILMMVRDRGHALTIDIDIAKENGTIVRYFVPKLCNRAMIEALPGVDKSNISENGANGIFETSKEEFAEKIIDFISKVPTDEDMVIPHFWEEEVEALAPNTDTFEKADIQELTATRKMGKIREMVEKIKGAVKRLRKKEQEQKKGEENDR